MNMAVACPPKTFRGHSLAEQMQAQLMNRVDTKFLVPAHLIDACLRGLEHHYSILEIDGNRQFTYDTLYFDTPGRQLYLDHHNGKLNRYKLRIRHYRETGDSFLEVKKKNNRQRTIKSRLPLTANNLAGKQVFPFLDEHLGLPVAGMLPALFVCYRRMTLMSARGIERITVDTNITFQSVDHRNVLTLTGAVIVEIKCARKNVRSPLIERLGQLGCRPVQFSKYCIGTGLLFGHECKTNRFKPLLRSLHGICS